MIKRYKARELSHPSSLETMSLIYEDEDFVLAADHEATLMAIHAELTDHGHQELAECGCDIARELANAVPKRGIDSQADAAVKPVS